MGEYICVSDRSDSCILLILHAIKNANKVMVYRMPQEVEKPWIEWEPPFDEPALFILISGNLVSSEICNWDYHGHANLQTCFEMAERYGVDLEYVMEPPKKPTVEALRDAPLDSDLEEELREYGRRKSIYENGQQYRTMTDDREAFR